MHPADCPTWEYRQHPHAGAVGIRCEAILNSLRNGKLPIDATLRDTRPLHADMFVNLTPATCPYYAGRYRGEKPRCLRHHPVTIQSDPRVGAAPARVAPDLANLNAHIIGVGLKTLDTAFAKSDSELPPEEKLNYLVIFACRVMVEFFRIHPYVNGNGHVGRLIVWLLLARFGYWPKKWPLDGTPSYSTLIKQYRDGDRLPLQKFVLESIIG